MAAEPGLRIFYSPDRDHLTILATPKELGWSLNTEFQDAGLRPASMLRESGEELAFWTLLLSLPGNVAALIQIAQAIRGWHRKNPDTAIEIKRSDGTEVNATGYSAEDIATILGSLNSPQALDE